MGYIPIATIDKTLFNVSFTLEDCQISRNPDHIVSFLKSRIIYGNEIPKSRFSS